MFCLTNLNTIKFKACLSYLANISFYDKIKHFAYNEGFFITETRYGSEC